jgi:hypothetical protein
MKAVWAAAVVAALIGQTACGQAPAERPAPATSTSAPAEKLPTAEELLARAVDAIGGRAALEKHHVRFTRGALEMPDQNIRTTRLNYTAAPNKYYTTFELPGMGKIESGSDGQTCWMSAGGQPRLLDGDDQALRMRDAEFHFPLNWQRIYTRAQVVGVADVAGTPCYKLEMTPEHGAAHTYYYDREGLLRQTEMLVVKPAGAILVQVQLDDYRRVAGVLMPHRMVQTVAGQKQTVTLDEIVVNGDVPPGRFDLPDAIQRLKAQAPSATPTGTPATPAPPAH